jgi:hypothetical protein
VPAPGYLGSYPSARFAFPRSYAYQLSIIDATATVILAGDTIIVMFDASIGYFTTYVLDPRFLPWTSNRCTLDFIVLDCWWQAFFDGVHHVQSFTTNHWYRGTPAVATVSLINPFASAMEHFIPLPSQPSDYWLAPPFE